MNLFRFGFAVFDHEVKSVEDVRFGGAEVEVEEEDVHLREDFFDSFFQTF